MLSGLASASIKVKPLCICRKCGNSKVSSSQYTIDIEVCGLSSLQAYIEHQLCKLLYDPPVGWSVNGRGADGELDFLCDSCMGTKGHDL